MADVRMPLHDGSLADLLDRLVATGAVIDGNLIITLAGVDLIRLDLHAMLAGTETVRPYLTQPGTAAIDEAPSPNGRQPRPPPVARPAAGAATPAGGPPPADPRRAVTRPAEPTSKAAADRSGRHDTEDKQPALAGLVVAVVDIVRQLLERQALRRMEAGSLTGDEVEHLGRALMALERQVTELTEVLGLRRRQPPGNSHGTAAEGSQ